MTLAVPDRLGPLGAALPQVGADGVNRSDHGAVAALAESLGYRGIWVCELTSAPVVDPLLLLAHAAATTKSAMLGVAVLLGPLHSPVRLANQLASLDVLSAGRLVVGFGYGSNSAIYPRYGLSSAKRLTRYLDTVEVIQRLWANDNLDYDNGLWVLEGPTNVVTPVQRPRPPLFMGARRPVAIERCVRMADGWVVSGSAPPEEVSAGRELVHRTLDETDRDRATFTIAQRLYVAVDSSEGHAMDRMAGWFGENYGKPEIAEKSSVVGSIHQIVDHIGTLHSGGVDHVIVNPVFDEADQLAQIAAAVAV